VLWENRKGNLIDIFSLGEEDYLKLCKEYASYLDDPQNLTKYTLLSFRCCKSTCA
jgi:hypothetical protein